MLERMCHRALQRRILCPALPQRLPHPSAFHCYATSPLRRPGQSQQIWQRWPPSRRKASTWTKAKKLFKENPFTMTLATVIIIIGMGGIVYVNYVYQGYIIGNFKAFPEPVAAKLRRALYYTNIDPQPANAVKYYRQALQVAAQLGLDQFSDELLGIKIQLANLFEKNRMYDTAIEVLELVRKDCLEWLEEVGAKPGNEGRRTKVLVKTIQISVKLGEYYANEYVANQEAAEERLVWAVTALLKEQKRRDDEGVKEGEGEWMSNEEIGGALESLGHHYEDRDQHYLSVPLFLQALGLCPPKSCHSVVLMNNLAISLAQQNPPPSLTPNDAPTSAAGHLSDARQWGLRALALSSSIKPPERTEECDEACAVATINLGDFAMMEGDVAEARKRFEEGKSLSKAIGFPDGIGRADESLKELQKRRYAR